jgi:hypothetical protein
VTVGGREVVDPKEFIDGVTWMDGGRRFTIEGSISGAALRDAVAHVVAVPPDDPRVVRMVQDRHPRHT